MTSSALSLVSALLFFEERVLCVDRIVAKGKSKDAKKGRRGDESGLP